MESPQMCYSVTSFLLPITTTSFLLFLRKLLISNSESAPKRPSGNCTSQVLKDNECDRWLFPIWQIWRSSAVLPVPGPAGTCQRPASGTPAWGEEGENHLDFPSPQAFLGLAGCSLAGPCSNKNRDIHHWTGHLVQAVLTMHCGDSPWDCRWSLLHEQWVPSRSVPLEPPSWANVGSQHDAFRGWRGVVQCKGPLKIHCTQAGEDCNHAGWWKPWFPH